MNRRDKVLWCRLKLSWLCWMVILAGIFLEMTSRRSLTWKSILIKGFMCRVSVFKRFFSSQLFVQTSLFTPCRALKSAKILWRKVGVTGDQPMYHKLLFSNTFNFVLQICIIPVSSWFYNCKMSIYFTYTTYDNICHLRATGATKMNADSSRFNSHLNFLL